MTELSDDTPSSLESNQIPFLFNKSFFQGEPDTIITASSSSNFTPCQPSYRSKQKRNERFFICKWCERKVTELFFETGCVPECAISYFACEFPELYDLAFIELSKHSFFEQEGVHPICLPPRDPDAHPTVKSYWRFVLTTVYRDPTDVRKRMLVKSLSKNSMNSVDGSYEELFEKSARQKK
jgi:hypothetical protein